MLNLSELVFKVNTEALVDATNKVAALGKSVDSLSTNFSKLEKNSAQASKAQAKAEKDLAAAEVDRAKAADIAAKTEERKAKAVKETAKATDEATQATKTNVSILERQQTILEYQANGYSKGQASILAYAKAAGVAATEIQEIGKVLQAQRTLMGGDPFDKSLGSLKSLQNEFKTLKEVQRLYTAEIPLTRKQMENLALDKLRLIEAMKIEGRSMSDIKAAIKSLNVEYITTAQNINRVTKAENELDKARKDSANANAYLEKEMQRVNFALQAQNNELNKGTANALNRFEQNLKRSGLTLDQQRVKMEEYRKSLLALEKTKGGNTDYITRALGPQITDIFVGLATGQAPLTVMLQQGGQLRDQFALAGVAAADMGKTMRTAARDMVVSVAAVAKAFGDLLLGAFIDTGKGIVNLIGNVTGLNKVLEYARYQLTLFAMTDPSFGGPLLKLFNGLRVAVIGFAATMAATGVGALIAMAVALKQVISENDTLAKSLALSGGALGISQSSAIEYVKSLGEVGVTTGKATEAIAEMAKAGVFAKEDILLVGKAAADMATYAGIGVDDTVKQFAKLKEKPVEALFDIAKATGMVAPEILKMVIELEKSGRSAEAAALAMKTYGDVTATQVAQMKENYNGFSLFIIELGKGIKQFFSDTFKTLFLATDPTEQLKDNLGAIQKRIKEVQDNQKTNSFFGISADPRLLDNLKEQERQLLKNLDRQVANNQAKEQESVINAANARIEAAKFKMFESTEDKLDKQLKKTKTLGEWQTFYTDKQIEKLAKEANVNKDQIKLTDEQIEKTKELAKVEWDRAQKKGKKDPTENYYAALMRDATNATIQADEATQDLTKSQIKMLEVIADPRFSKLTEVQKSNILNTYAKAAADEKVVAGQELINKLLGKGEGLGKEYYKTLKELESLKGNAGIDQEELEKALQALRDTTPAAKKAKAEIEAAAKAYNEYAAAAQTIKDSVAAENNQLDFRMSLLGKTSEEQRKMTIEHERTLKLLEAEAKYQKEILKIRKDTRLQEDPLLMAKALQDTEEAFAEQRKAINRGVAVAYAEDIQKEFDRISGGITDSIVTALFEGGKAGSKKLRDLIMSELRKPVTIVVQAVVNTLLGSVIGGLTGSSGGVGGAAAGLLGNAAVSAGGSALGSAIGLGNAGSLLSGFTGSTISASMVGPSVAAPTLMSGLGNMAAAIPGWGWAIAGIAALAGLMSKKATPHAGAGSTFSAASGLQNINLGAANNMGFMANYAKETQGLTDQIAKTLVTALDSTAKSFGTTAGYAVSAAFADDTSKDGAWGQLIIQKLDVGDIVNWGLESVVGKWAPKEFADGAAGQQEYMNAIAKSARDALKDAIGDVRWAQNMLDALGDSPTIEQLSSTVDQINQAQTAITNLGKNIQGFASMTNDAISSLVEASGGAQAFFANMQSFYDSFYSDAEKTANQSRDIAEALAKVGLAMPTTREEYRKMVEQQLALGESGSKAAATLLQYSNAFANITQSQQDLAQAEQDRLNTAVEAYKNQQRDMLNVQIDAAQAQMDMFQKTFDFLSEELKKLYGSVESTAKMQLAKARQIIQSAIGSKTLPDAEVLQDAVGTVTGSFNSSNYSSKIDAERDRLKFAAQLEELKNLAGNSLNSAKNTFDLLKLQLSLLDDQTLIYKQQLEGIYEINKSIKDVVIAITKPTQASSGSSSPTGLSSGGGGGSAGSPSYLNNVERGKIPLANYGADEALSSFDKFKPWYQGLRSNAEMMRPEGYETPDWLRVGGWAADASEEALFKAFLFYQNNPSAALDYEAIMKGGVSSLPTNGSSLIQTDLSKLPKEVRDYYTANPSALLMYEGFGMDPTLGYMLQQGGGASLGVDPTKMNVATWLRGNKWTEQGIVANDNVLDYTSGNYGGTQLARYDPTSGTIVNIDGNIYTPDGKLLGTAGRGLMESLYGAGFIDTVGANYGYGDKRKSTLYSANINAGHSEEHYYGELKKNLDQFMSSGISAQGLADIMMQNGVSLEDAAVAYGVSAAEIAANLRNAGATTIPAFAKGGKYSGGLALVGEDGPELINFNNPGYVHTSSQTSKILSQDDFATQLQLLNDKVGMLEAAARSTAISNNKIAKLLDRLTPDGNSLQVKTVQGSVTTTVP